MNFNELYAYLENYTLGKLENANVLIEFNDGTFLCGKSYYPEIVFGVYSSIDELGGIPDAKVVEFSPVNIKEDSIQSLENTTEEIMDYISTNDLTGIFLADDRFNDDEIEESVDEEREPDNVQIVRDVIVDELLADDADVLKSDWEDYLTQIVEEVVSNADVELMELEYLELTELVQKALAKFDLFVDDTELEIPSTVNFDKLYNETVGGVLPYKNTYDWYVTTIKYYGPNGKRLIKFGSNDLDECKANAGGRGDHVTSRSNLEYFDWDVNDPNSWLEFFDEKAFLDKDPICQYCHEPMDKEKFEAQKRASENPDDFVYNSGVCSDCANKLMQEYSGPGGHWTGD